MGFKNIGCRVIWNEIIDPNLPLDVILRRVAELKQRLDRYGFSECLSVWSKTDDPLPKEASQICLGLDDACEADLLVNIRYNQSAEVLNRFIRTAFIDIDPGILQHWMSEGVLKLAPHDIYFTIGETVGTPHSRIPDCDLKWIYTPPCVDLDWWLPSPPKENASYTTVSHWYMKGAWMKDLDGGYIDDKRSGFMPYLDLPKHTSQPLELALHLAGDNTDRAILEKHGWTVREAHEVTSTPWDYERYIKGSVGEFSCAKPSTVRFQSAWISDRTICYLASGKPCIVQNTGPSSFLPSSEGLFRFANLEEAILSLDKVAEDYDRQCILARKLAQEYFDSKKVVTRLLEYAL